MTRFSRVCAVIAVVGATQTAAFAAPVQIDFNVTGFGVTSGQSDTFMKTGALAGVDLTFMALDDQMQAAGLLYWDAGDQYGFRDGFGIMDSDGYEADELEGDERLALQFSKAVNLYGFNLTDFFHEQEPFDVDCTDTMPACYIETGSYMVQFADGTTSAWTDFHADPSQTRLATNGLFDVAMNFQNVVGLVLRAPDQIQNDGFLERHDFSLAGIRVEAIPAPEPGTLMLLGLGLTGLAARMRRRSSRA